jgi:hypothetical protein
MIIIIKDLQVDSFKIIPFTIAILIKKSKQKRKQLEKKSFKIMPLSLVLEICLFTSMS